MSAPFFSIITATYNAAAVLPRLLDSLTAQTCRDFELIIQDGASTDATATVADACRGRLPALVIASEPDTGIYDAWNKALTRARGEWVLFLGADDRLAGSDTLERVRERLTGIGPEKTFAAGAVEMELPGGRAGQRVFSEIAGATAALSQGIPAPHSALFHRRSLFHTHIFDTRFRISGDYEFLCRAWKSDNQAVQLDMLVTRMGWGGLSSRPQAAFVTRWEYAKAASRHFSRRAWTLRRLKILAGGLLIAGLCRLMGPVRAARALDRLRVLRGLPPCWGSGAGHE